MRARHIPLSILLLGIIGPSRRSGSGQKPVPAVQKNLSLGSGAFGNFTVTPVLSSKAMRALIGSKETVIVSAMFSARPKPGIQTHRWADSVADNLGFKDIEVSPGATARFGAIVVPHDPKHRLDESAPNLLINVVSGRRSSKNNLLDCDIYEDTLWSATGKDISLNCKLIRE